VDGPAGDAADVSASGQVAQGWSFGASSPLDSAAGGGSSLDHLVRAHQERLGNRQAEGLGQITRTGELRKSERLHRGHRYVISKVADPHIEPLASCR